MASLVFNLLDLKTGLYRSADNTNQVLSLYYLAGVAPAGNAPVEFADIWQSTEGGCFFFLPVGSSISDFETFAVALKAALGKGDLSGQRWIAWVADTALSNGALPVTANIPVALTSQATSPTTAAANLPFVNLGFNIPQATNLSIGGSDTAPVFSLLAAAGGKSLMSIQGSDPLSGGTYSFITIDQKNPVDIPLTGAHTGVLNYAAAWDRGAFYRVFLTKLGQENLEYASPSAEFRFEYNDSAPVSLRYPFFIGQIERALPNEPTILFLNVSMDVLNPLNGQRTRFALDLDKFSPAVGMLPIADAFRNNAGKTLYLNPKPDPNDAGDPLKVAGFAVSKRPHENNPKQPVLYLVPIGHYAVASTSNGTATPGKIDIMCGLSGSEFLLAAEGDLLEFSNQAQAFAVGYDPGSHDNTDVVNDTYTSAWLRLIPGPNSGTVFPGAIKESYCVQAPDSVYYSPSSEAGFALAAGIRLADLSNPSKTTPFPMVPYGNVYLYDQRKRFQVPNLNIPADTLHSFEFDVLSPLRRQMIQPDLCNGPIFFDTATGMPLQGGYVRTPIGLLAALNDGTTPANTPAGTIQRLILAKSPVNGQYLQFTAAPSPYCAAGVTPPPTVVSPKLSTALIQNSVFLVASNASLGNIGPFDNEIQLGEFTFQINLSGKPLSNAGDKMTIMLFKFSSLQSVEQLAADPSKWTAAADFVGDAAAVSDVSARILQSIADAGKIVSNGGVAAAYFQDFYTKMTDPEWTGVIALNTELDYELLPIDMQVLLGGIDGELTAHHFGVTINQIKADQPADTDIDNSSLFGLIYYNKDYQPTSRTFDFQVTKLNVLFVNSVMADFQAQIAMTVTQLYGDTVKLDQGGPNDKPANDAILIDGVYLKNGTSGHIVFDSSTPRFFSFPHNSGALRILKNVVITDAALVPVSATTANGKTTVKAAFQLNGAFGFAVDISSDGSGVDLFSYPVNPLGGPANAGTLNFKCHDLVWDTLLDGNNATLAYPITADLNNLQLESDAAVPRDNSLVATFPLNLTGFKWAPGGLNAETLGAKQVTGLKSLGVGSAGGPVYSLVFSLPMGNLGMLSSGVALQATVYLGWSPASGPSDSNVASFLFVPPSQFSSGDGGFKLQGIIDTVYGDLLLNRFPLDDKGTEKLFVLQLQDVQFTILAFNLLPTPPYQPDYAPRTLTLFGDPNKPKGSNLSWFLSNPSGSSSPVKISADAYSILGLMNGLKVNTNLTGTSVISTAIDQLTGASSSPDSAVIKSIHDQQKIGNTSFEYDPSAGVLFYVDFKFSALAFKILLADPSFYGGLLTLDDASSKKGDKDPDKDKDDSFLKKWGGLSIELSYRKISDGLGLWSVHFTVPKSIRVIPNAEAPVNFTLPSFGLGVYTNGDFRIEVGWPFGPGQSDAEPAKLSFVVDGIPLFVSIGLYIAKLRGADVPTQFPSSFKLIYMFGLGLAFGIDAKYPKDSKKDGIIKAEFQLYIWGTFQGMLVSKTGDIGKNGLDYQWWAATLGVTLNLSGSINLKIIVVSLTIEATLYVSLAIETGHSTVAEIGADFSVKLKVKILFITIQIKFSHHFTLATLRLGSGPDALISGPTPCELPEYQGECGQKTGAALELVSPAAKTPVLKAHTANVSAAARASNTPIPITIYYLLQPTTLSNDGVNWLPQAVSSLLIEFDSNSTGAPAPDNPKPFTQLLNVLAYHLAQQAPGDNLDAQLTAMSALVHSDNYFEQADDFLASNFIFTIDGGSTLSSGIEVAVFPMFPQCQIDYNGVNTAFNGPLVPADYIQQLQQYLSQYSNQAAIRADNGATPPMSVAALLFKDYFVMLAQQLVNELQQAAQAGATDLESALAAIDTTNIAGFVSHFMLSGLRLPTFDGTTVRTAESDWQGMYELAGLQTALVKNGAGYADTFTLSLAETEATAAGYIKFAGDQNNVVEKIAQDQILTQAPSLDWLSASGGGIAALDPLAASRQNYHLAQPSVFTANGQSAQLFLLPDAMQKVLAQMEGLQASLSLLPDSNTGASQTRNQGSSVSGTPALFIPIQIKKVALPNSAGGADSVYYPNTYAIGGVDQYVRELLGLFLNQFDNQATLSFMIGTGNNNYQAPSDTSQIILVKNNLSTDAEPDTELLLKQAPLGPVQATLGQVQDFLQLVWEESVVNTAGYYLHIENVPENAFDGETATIALLLQSGEPASVIALQPYHNLVVVAQPLEKGALAAAIMDHSGNPVLVYQPNYAPGFTGFTAKWLDAPTEVEIQDQSVYIETLYRTVQFRVTNIEGVTPPAGGYNWSMPSGANNLPGTTEDTSNWIFRQNIPVFKLIGSDPYAAVGKTVGLDIRILDIYGNELPGKLIQPLTTEVVYNDPLTPFTQLQWFQINYAVSPGATRPVLNLEMSFDAQTVADILASSDNAQQQISKVAEQYAVAIGQLNDPNTSMQMQTSLAANAFTQDNTGAQLKDSIQKYLQSVLYFLQNTGTQAPAAAVLNFDLDFTQVVNLQDDIFSVDVAVLFSREAARLDPAVLELLPTVGSVTNTILPYVTTGDDVLADAPSLSAFADQFEKAYEGFDGAAGQLKIGKGSDFSDGLKNARKNAIWAIKWSAKAGIDINAAPQGDQAPAYFAPPPLSTQLLTRKETVIQYTSGPWNGSNSDIENADLPVQFTNIDLDAWGLQFLNAFHNFITPEMAASVAKLDGNTYDALMLAKSRLAEAIAQSIAPIIIPDNRQEYGDLVSAREKILQSLLNSLTNDYGTSALVQIPAQVIVNGEVESNTPATAPSVYGKLSANTPEDGDTPYTVSNAILPLVDGTQYLNFLVSAKHPEQQADLDLQLFYDIAFIRHQLEASEGVDGYIPGSWITIVLPARAANNGQTPPPLQLPLPALSVPIPLRAFPSAPSFNAQTAVVNTGTTDINQLLQWSYALDLNRPGAAQDDLMLEVSYNEGIDTNEATLRTNRAGSSGTTRPAPVDLFEALARFAYEYPAIQPYLEDIPDAAFQSTNVPVATAALARMYELVEGVAGQWSNWQNPALRRGSTALRAFTGDAAQAGIQVIDQRYKIICAEDGQTITITGLSYASAQSSNLSDLPYPEINGYVKGTVNNNVVVYTLKSGTAAPASLQLSFNGLNIGTHQSAIARAYIERNVDIAPSGYSTNPAFVFNTAVVSFRDPIVPLIEVDQPITLPAAASLSQVISDYFNNFLGSSAEAGVIMELQFALEAGSEFQIAQNPFYPTNVLMAQTPLLFSQIGVATPANSTGQPPVKLQDYTAGLVQQILQWHRTTDPQSPAQPLYLSFVLFADVSASKLPLLRFRELLIVPPANNPGWWS